MLLFYFMIFLILLVAIVLTGVVLLQSGKGGGLAGIAAGGQTQQILGARQAPDFLEKSTWVLGVALMVLCVITTMFTGTDDQTTIITDEGVEVAPAPLDATPGDALPLEPAPAEE
ncbi:MAG: preprotein translocase subunit SecG [Bacteroidota bacterium]